MSLLSGLLSFVLLVFSVWAVVDVLLTRKEDIRNFHKIFWVLITVVFGAFAGLSWLWVGRPRKVGFLPGGKNGALADIAANAGVTIPGLTAPSATPAETGPVGFTNPADQSTPEDLAPEAPAPEAAMVIDLTEPTVAPTLPPAPLGPEDSEGWAEWSTIAVAENQFNED